MEIKIYLLVVLIGFLSALYHAGEPGRSGEARIGATGRRRQAAQAGGTSTTGRNAPPSARIALIPSVRSGPALTHSPTSSAKTQKA
jgi:hypothetical protein